MSRRIAQIPLLEPALRETMAARARAAGCHVQVVDGRLFVARCQHRIGYEIWSTRYQLFGMAELDDTVKLVLAEPCRRCD